MTAACVVAALVVAAVVIVVLAALLAETVNPLPPTVPVALVIPPVDAVYDPATRRPACVTVAIRSDSVRRAAEALNAGPAGRPR